MFGIDISDRSIKVAELSDGRSRRLVAHGAHPLEEGVMDNGIIVQPAAIQTALQNIFQEADMSVRESDVAVVSIPEAQSFLRVIEVPEMHEDEVTEAVQWEVAQHIPFGLENVYIDWQPVVGEGHAAVSGKREVQVGAAQQKVVDALYAALSVFPLDIGAFELESQAIVRALISPELRAKQGLLVIDLGMSATNVVIHDHGAMRFTATLQQGVINVTANLPAADREKINTMPHTLQKEELDQLGMQLLPAIEELVVEIRGVVEFYNSIDAQHEVKEIILTGGGSNVPGLDRAFLKYFDEVHIQKGNPWVNVLQGRSSPTLPLNLTESVRYTTAIGLALRSVIR
jgi:type IV pilus assembly protein PilM